MLRVRTSFSGIVGAPYLSTMYFMTGDTLTDAQNANAAVGTFWSAVDNNLMTGLAWSTLPAVDVLTAAGVLTGQHGVTPVTGGGALSGILAPPATQGLVRWSTGVYVGGRQIRGRTFIPGINTTSISGGAPTGGLVTATNSAAAALIADANANLCIWSRKNATMAAVTAGGLWTSFAVLRSRRD